MPTKVLAVTSDSPEGGRFYVGDLFTPPSLVSVYSEADTLPTLCMIKSTDENRMIVLGLHFGAPGADMYWSNDSGATWAKATGVLPNLATGAEARKFFFAGGDTVYLLTLRKLYKSTDNGETYTDITVDLPPILIGPTAGFYVDMIMRDANNGLLLTTETNAVGGGKIWSTADGGATWVERFDCLTGVPGWSSGDVISPSIVLSEEPRRIAYRAVLPGNDLLLLTSHKIYRMPQSGPGWLAPNVIWDTNADLDALYPASAPWKLRSGAQHNPGSGATNSILGSLDEMYLDIPSGRVWIAGTNNFRFHSFDQSTFLPSDLPYMDGSGVLLSDTSWHSPLNGSILLAGNKRTGPALASNHPGIWSTVDGGVSVQNYRVFTPGELAQHSWLVRTPPFSGCTISTACNYDPLATIDDGSCQQAVILSNCVTGSLLHVNTPEVSALACRNPRFGFDIGNITSNPQSIQIVVDGSQIVLLGTFEDPLDPDAISNLIQTLIFVINSTTSYIAVHIPTTQNPFVAGSPNGVWIYCLDTTCSGLSVQINAIGLSSILNDANFDAGASAGVVTLQEYPGECWAVCGQGDCALVTPGTLLASYQDCFRCVPIVPPLACMDCDTMASIGESFLTSSATSTGRQCVVAGQSVRLQILAGFPVLEPTTIVPQEVGTGCIAGVCPITLTFADDVTMDFPVGSTYCIQPSGNTYTVASSSYDPLGGVTTVVSVEDCQGEAGITEVDTFCGCECSVTMTITNTVTDEVLEEEEWACVDGYVDQTTSWIVPSFGSYLIEVIAEQCGQTKICRFWLDACSQYEVIEVGCHQFEITLGRPVDPLALTHDVQVTNATTGAVILEQTVNDANFPISFTTPGDGLYTVTVIYVGSEPFLVQVLDLCDVRACRTKLVQEILCGDEDPCNEACGDAEERSRKRYEINRISLAWSELERLIHNYRYHFFGILEYTKIPQPLIPQIAETIAKLISMSNECGECNGTIDPNPCVTC